MNSLEYFGYAMLDCLAFWYIAEHHKSSDGYSVIDCDGLPLFGFVPNDKKEIHSLKIKQNLR